MKAQSIESLCQMVLARLANEPASVEEWEAIRRAMATATREAAKCRNAERRRANERRRRANERLRLRVPRIPVEAAS